MKRAHSSSSSSSSEESSPTLLAARLLRVKYSFVDYPGQLRPKYLKAHCQQTITDMIESHDLQ